ncbi:hypothetical protein [Corynebacterium flavescens]|uniref:hypothetical protein n=1 Tax=Corynebacterium flavescens TaxID=28028 RepID=UPI003FCF73FD
MACDQDDLCNAAKQLEELYRELDQAKYDRPQAPRESRIGSTKQMGPKDPLPIWTLSDDLEFTTLLSEYVNDAARFIPLDQDYYQHGFGRNGQRMCHWIAYNAGPISQLDVASVMLDELRHQVRELNHRLRRTRPPQPAEQEVWLTARTICYKLRQQGYDITPELLRQWAKRGQIDSVKPKSGLTLYPLSRATQRVVGGGMV